jgi:polysaccharide export outer membrane protein
MEKTKINQRTYLSGGPVPWLFIIAFLLIPLSNFATEAYVIGPGDVLEIKFWQDNTHDAAVTVRQDGKISLDIIGEVEAAGLTTDQLEREIIRQMSRFNKAISQAVVRVSSYGNLKVFVSGQVQNPGKFTFEVIPDIWTLINEAGGITETGDLTRVTIIRGGERSGQVEVVNISELMISGRRDELPIIYSDDTIEIPPAPAGLPGRTVSERAAGKNLFYAIGEVNLPGHHDLVEKTDLLDAIALAGGPTAQADFKKVTVITKDGLKTQTLEFNLNKYKKSGAPGRYYIRPEDTIIMGQKRSGFLGLGGSLTDLVTILGAASTAVLLITTLNDDNNN